MPAHGSGAPFRFAERESSDTAQEFEYRARLEKQREAQKALESELLAKTETLKGVHGSWTRMLSCKSYEHDRSVERSPIPSTRSRMPVADLCPIVAVKGGKVPVDAGSLVTSCEYDKRFEESGDTAALENTQTLDQVKIQVMIEDIDRPFHAGGHCIFMAFEKRCADIVTRSYAAGKGCSRRVQRHHRPRRRKG